ncbi:MAG: hypothetical protein RLZZ08_1641 [Pseudomonadota bacterium]|jgi:hypothetical protein
MPLHMTKIAFGATSFEDVRAWFAGDEPEKRTSTRYLPKRHEEMVGGSLYWVFQHAIIARSPILRFEQNDTGRWDIVLENTLIRVEPRAKRAHQGWRYLEDKNAPHDLAAGDEGGDTLPGKLVRELGRLGLA